MADIRTIQWADKLAYQRPGQYQFMWVPSDACHRGRNVMVQLAYRLPDFAFTHICTLDSDMLPQPDMLDRLLDHHLDIVAGCYPVRIANTPMWSFKVRADSEWWHGADPRVDPELMKIPTFPLIEVDALGGGGVLARRDVFDAIGYPWYQTIYQPLDDQMRSCTITEDVWFSKRAREQGFRLFVDVTCTCDHFKRVSLP